MLVEKTRLFAGAFLKCQDEVLLMKRSPHKEIAPGMWSGVGGHIEESEINSPITACLREIEEESGILPSQIEKLDLRYFALFKSAESLDSVYYFIGELKEKCSLRQTSEGTLRWVKLEDGIDYEMSNHVKRIYLHWINNLTNESLYCFLGEDINLLG